MAKKYKQFKKPSKQLAPVKKSNKTKSKTRQQRGETKQLSLPEQLIKARMLRARATSPLELQAVQTILRSILSKADKDSEEWTDAGTFLATLLLQQPRGGTNDGKVTDLLRDRGFSYHLSRQSLIQSHDAVVNTSSLLPSANAWDKVLPSNLLAKLSTVFAADSSFWTSHNYSDGSSQGEPPSPYFSYIVPLKQEQPQQGTVLTDIMRLLQSHIAEFLPDVMECSAAEWWCHCRPHASGHQLHFDSDDEGRGGVRNPVASCVLSLTEGVGGETLVTTQTSTATSLAGKDGWLCQGKRNRLLAFQGNLLHGVVPGSASKSSHDTARRITFMVAFWERIRVQDDEGPGSARPFSRVQDEEWAKPLMEKCDIGKEPIVPKTAQNCFFKVPVWHDVDEMANKGRGDSLAQMRKRRELPPYDSFFQFFT